MGVIVFLEALQKRWLGCKKWAVRRSVLGKGGRVSRRRRRGRVAVLLCGVWIGFGRRGMWSVWKRKACDWVV